VFRVDSVVHCFLLSLFQSWLRFSYAFNSLIGCCNIVSRSYRMPCIVFIIRIYLLLWIQSPLTHLSRCELLCFGCSTVCDCIATNVVFFIKPVAHFAPLLYAYYSHPCLRYRGNVVVLPPSPCICICVIARKVPVVIVYPKESLRVR
jgi:hypothetical protein